jgi:hypothetical protein
LPQTNEPFPLLRKLLPFTSAAVVIVAIYVGWTFYQRSSENREYERARVRKETADAKRTLDMVGGGDFKILNFYAVPGAIKRGSQAKVCYGVIEAKSVSIEPEIEPIQPAYNRCLQVSPAKTTEYTLTAVSKTGHKATQNFTLQVVR